MKTRAMLGLAIGGLAVVVLVGLVARLDRSPEIVPVDRVERTGSPAAPTVDAPVALNDAPTMPPAAAPQEPTAPSSSNDTVFRVDSSNRLVLDEQTRLNMEALFARTDRDDLAEAKQQAVEPLPPAASARAAELLDRYDNYQQAQRDTYPPGVAPSTEEAALAELDGLHALRVAHFGADVAEALYGAEERLSRSLIELMRLEKDQSLTMEEKAVRAQRLRDSMPELSEIERRNRDDEQ
jgi:hypothetical protein